jgi:hypothetical protein
MLSLNLFFLGLVMQHAAVMVSAFFHQPIIQMRKYRTVYNKIITGGYKDFNNLALPGR